MLLYKKGPSEPFAHTGFVCCKTHSFSIYINFLERLSVATAMLRAGNLPFENDFRGGNLSAEALLVVLQLKYSTTFKWNLQCTLESILCVRRRGLQADLLQLVQTLQVELKAQSVGGRRQTCMCAQCNSLMMFQLDQQLHLSTRLV